VEHRNGGRDIEVFCWATDDNPILKTDDVDRIMEAIGVSEDDDDDQKMMRRYGVFRQISGRIYKNFLTEIHRISFDKYFNEDAFRYFWHYRMIDYHPTKPWYVSFVAVSPTHEWYVWHELKLMHDRATTIDLRDTIKHSSLVDEEDMYNRRTLVDPLANIAQPNSGFTIMEDLARGPEGLRGVESAFTKTEQARQNIRRRINNSLTCGRPGNNLRKMGEPDPRFGNYLPTLWVMDTCPGHIEHFMKWRMVDLVHEHVKATNDEKRIAQKYSDFCRNIEFLGAEDPVWFELRQQYYNDERDWFNGQRKLA